MVSKKRKIPTLGEGNLDNFEFRFDRRDALRLSLESLHDALELQMIPSLSEVDLDWYKWEVEKLFMKFLPEKQK